LDEATFGYTPAKIILKNVNIDVQLDSRIAVIGPNGAGKSTLIKLLTGAIQPNSGSANHNARCRIAYFTQHHIDQLDSTMTPVQFLQHKFPGQVEQDYRSHLGAFGITGLTGIQKIGTLSGGQKSRVAFAVLSMSRPHILLLDEVSLLSSTLQNDTDGCSPVITWISRVSMP
jgi:ATP-binding cassette subfamily F protein 3